jgi:hypothetical protein
METKNREKLLLIATATVAALWLLNLLVFGPLIDSWHSRSDEIAKLKKEIAEGTTLARREPTIRDRWDNMRANALPNNPTLAERQLFTAFDHWVGAGRVTEGSFRPQVQDGDTNFSTVDCRSDVSGNIQAMSEFLKAMSKDPLANKVASFELAAKDDNGQQLTLGLSLSGLILTDSDPSSFAPTTPPPAGTNAAANTNVVASAEPDLFQIIARNNIFNQSRTFRENGVRPPTPKVDTITFHGAASSSGLGSAYFSGTGVSDQREYKVGDSLTGDLKIARIINTVDGDVAAILTNSSSNTFTLNTGSNASMRREDNGPWRVMGYIAAVTTPATNSTESTVSSPGTGTGAEDILARLRKRREAE